MSRLVRPAAFVVIVLLSNSGTASQVAFPPSGTVVERTLSSAALKGNLLGDPAESRVAVYLPPSYAASPQRRYPTLYLLHGYLGTFESFGVREGTPGYQGMQFPTSMDDVIRRGTAREMIVVMPNARNAYFGSFYTNSSVTGRWEDLIVQEMVPWIDANYRTIPNPASRGIAGHSMGGYGAIMLAMKHPDVFSALYALSPCCIGLEADLSLDNPAWLKASQLKSKDELQRPRSLDEFYIAVFIALSAALSPNPMKADLYVDLPFHASNGRLVQNDPAYSDWRSKMPLYLVEQYRKNLEKLSGIYLDYGALEGFSHIRTTTRSFSDELTSRGVAHTFEVYANGDHGNKIRERLETRVFRFFSEVLRDQ